MISFLLIPIWNFKTNAGMRFDGGKKGRRDRIYIRINAHTNAVYSFFEV
jgi:hypothetical protein